MNRTKRLSKHTQRRSRLLGHTTTLWRWLIACPQFWNENCLQHFLNEMQPALFICKLFWAFSTWKRRAYYHNYLTLFCSMIYRCEPDTIGSNYWLEVPYCRVVRYCVCLIWYFYNSMKESSTLLKGILILKMSPFHIGKCVHILIVMKTVFSCTFQAVSKLWYIFIRSMWYDQFGLAIIGGCIWVISSFPILNLYCRLFLITAVSFLLPASDTTFSTSSFYFTSTFSSICICLPNYFTSFEVSTSRGFSPANRHLDGTNAVYISREDCRQSFHHSLFKNAGKESIQPRHLFQFNYQEFFIRVE